MLKIYLVKPMYGHPYTFVSDHILPLRDKLEKMGYFVFHPLTAKPYLSQEQKLQMHYDYPASTEHAISDKDHWCVRQSDVILADLSGVDKASIGSCFELAWAQAYGKLVLTVMEDGNVHEHPMVTEATTIRYRKLDDAIEYLQKLIKANI